MQRSIQRLRWVLVAGALLLVAVLAVYIGYGHYRMLNAYRRILARSGVTISRDSEGVTYSQSVGGKKIFTLRAARETSLGNSRWALHDADLLLYTRSPDHPDHIYGKEFEYDEKEGVARALGEVFMDLQAPDALAGTGYSGTPAEHGEAGGPATAGSRPSQVIHVRTSGLVYVRKLGVAATDQEVEFAYGGMQCSALGADFNTGQNVLHLLARVRMDGVEHGQPVHLTALRADIDRNGNVVNLTQPVVLSQDRAEDRTQDRRASAEQAVLELRRDGSIEQAHGIGSVVLSSGNEQVTAERLDATLSPRAVPETARLSGNVVLTGTDPRRPMHGAARQVDAVFDAQGEPTSVVATGAGSAVGSDVASLAMVDHTDAAAGAHGLEREIEGAKLVALFAPSPGEAGSRGSGVAAAKSRLSEVQATGSAATGAAKIRGESLVAATTRGNAGLGAKAAAAPHFKMVQIAADRLQIMFAANAGGQTQPQPQVRAQVQPQQLVGTGHTLIEQDAPLGEQEVSRGNTLDVRFAAAAAAPAAKVGGSGAGQQQLAIASAVQAGQVTILDRAGDRAAAHGQTGAREPGASRPAAAGSGAGGVSMGEVSTGRAQRAVYDGAAGTVTLSGDVRLESGTVSLLAPTVVLDQPTGNAEARGGVQTTLLSAASGAGYGSAAGAGSAAGTDGKPEPVTHVLSSSANFNHALKLSEFRGSDAAPARMWQDASQVQAAVLVLDGMRHTFSARPDAPGGLVHAVFAGRPAVAKANAATTNAANTNAAQTDTMGAKEEREGHNRSEPGVDRGEALDYVRVASPRMGYNDLLREATFSGGVRIDGEMGEVRGERAVVFLKAALPSGPAKPARSSPTGEGGLGEGGLGEGGLLGGSLDRVVVSDGVRLEQPGRLGTGEQLLYTAATDSYVLTGTPGQPPRVTDAQQGSVTGTTLLFSGAGSTIVVSGGPKSGRVRTETEVRQ